jgi:hypothetical protein
MSRKSRRLQAIDNEMVQGGHQVVQARSYPHKLEEERWVNSNANIMALLDKVFPRWEQGGAKGRHATRWRKVIQTYFRTRFTARQTAEEMDLTVHQVKSIVRSIRRTYAGLRADGGGTWTRPRGAAKVIDKNLS